VVAIRGEYVSAIKSAETQSSIPSAWRLAFKDVVNAFALRDYQLTSGVAGVEPVSAQTAAHIRRYIEDYGEPLIELPEQTWDSSVCIWTGTHWDVLIDIWTASEGRSDLVLGARVFESDPDYRIQIGMVYVP